MNRQGPSGRLFAENKKHSAKVAVYEAWIRRAPGLPVCQAEERIARDFDLSVSTVKRYIKEISENGYQPADKPKQGRKIYAWDPEAIDFLKGFYIATQRAVGYCTMRNAYNKTLEMAKAKGWKAGSEQSAYTHLRDIHSLLITYASGGSRALDNIFYIARDLSALSPFHVVVGDQHEFDFWVIYEGRKIRPQCYLWLDMRTRLVYGIAFEPGPYNHRTVARALKMGIMRFGKFNSTYNDNGAAEKSGKIDRLVNALQTYGMGFKDTSDLYRTRDGSYAIEDPSGSVVAAVDLKEWRKENRRMYATVKNAKAKPIERFFRTLEILLLDMCLPGYVRDLRASAAEDEEATRRLGWQEERGYFLGYEEFINKVRDAIVCYESRDHAGLKRSPLEELRKAREEEGWEPVRIDENDVRHIFLESERRVVKGNRVVIAGINYVGPVLTREMVKENRNNLAGLSGQRVDVYYDPDDLDAGAWAMDPRTGKPIYLTPEDKVDPFNIEAVSQHIEDKRSSMKAVSGVFRDTAAFAGNVLTSPEYKPFIESEAAARKAVADKTAAGETLTDEDFQTAVGSRLVQEQGERARRQAVYSTPMKRYQAVLDTILSGGELSAQDRLYKADYESRMGDIEKTRWQVYIDLQHRKE